MESATRAAPDWYGDPGGRHEFRYWDGDRWTDGVADGGTVTEEPPSYLPATAEQPTALPGQAAWLALLGLVVGLVFAVIGEVLGLLVARHVLAVHLLLAQIGLWTGLIGACWLASRRYGTGRLRPDLHIAFERRDILRGLGAAFFGRILVIVIAIVLYLVNHKLTGGKAAINDELKSKNVATLVVAIILALGAPLIEETFFRGLLMQSLQTRWGPVVAVPGSAIGFGLCHLSPEYGLGNVAVMATITTVGLILGWLAFHYRRLGPGIWAHGWFNLTAVLLLAAT